MAKKRSRFVPGGVLATTDTTALVPSNVRVQTVAFVLRWRRETLIRRVEAALPSTTEQQIYLKVAGGFRVMPETVKTMLEVFRGSAELLPQDMVSSHPGRHYVVNTFDIMHEKVEKACDLIRNGEDKALYPMSAEHAAILVEFYDSAAYDIVGMLVDNVFEVGQKLGMTSESERVIVGVAISTLAKRLKAHKKGSPMPLTIDDMFAHHEVRTMRGINE